MIWIWLDLVSPAKPEPVEAKILEEMLWTGCTVIEIGAGVGEPRNSYLP
jgi:hypothetical protein